MENGRIVNGHVAGICADPVSAHVHALMKLLVKRQKMAPEAQST